MCFMAYSAKDIDLVGMRRKREAFRSGTMRS